MGSVDITFEWDETDQAALRRRLSNRRTRIGQICSVAADPFIRFIDWYGHHVVATAVRRAAEHSDTGAMGRGVKFRWEPGAAVVEATAPYSAYVETGTRPHWPPVQALEGWAQRHGIPAFLVARKIAREGTPATLWFTKAIRDAEVHLPTGLRNTATQITMAWNAGV